MIDKETSYQSVCEHSHLQAPIIRKVDYAIHPG